MHCIPRNSCICDTWGLVELLESPDCNACATQQCLERECHGKGAGSPHVGRQEDRPHRNHYPLLSLRTPLTSLTASRKSLTMSPKLSAPSPSEGMSHAAERHMGTKKRCNNRWVRRGGHRSVICYQRCYLGNHGMRRLGLHIFYARAWLHLPGCCLANSLDSWTKAVGCAYVHPSPAAAAGKRQTRGCCLGRVLEVKLLWKRRLPKGNHS